MGLFGGILKVVGKIGGGVLKAAASKVTGGLSDNVLKAVAAKKGNTNQAQAAALKYSVTPPRELRKPPANIPEFLSGKAARLAKATAPRTPRAPRARKPPRPCKYGPRGEDGYCPPRPSRASAASPDYDRPRPRPRSRRMTAYERGISQGITGVLKEGAAGAVKKAAAIRAASTPVGKGLFTGGAKAVALNAAKLSGIGLAGLAAYKATRAIMLSRQLSRQQAEEAARVEATSAAMQHARETLGRRLTGPEMAQINLEVERRLQGA